MPQCRWRKAICHLNAWIDLQLTFKLRAFEYSDASLGNVASRAVKVICWSPVVQYTDQEMIPARNARNVVTLAEVMFVTIQRENIRHSKKETNKAVTMLNLPDVCS
jgi:hypothetical protein